MVYFLINNNYHWYDSKIHINKLRNENISASLIQVPHKLDLIETDVHLTNNFVIKSPFISKAVFLNPFIWYRKKKTIDGEFKFLDSNDTLILYTEYEFLNHYFITLFKNKGAKVMILEEGMATYTTFFNKSDSLSLKHIFKLKYMQYILGFTKTHLNYYNNVIFPQVSDTLIDTVLLYHNVDIKRNIKKNIINKNIVKLDGLDSNIMMFLNEKMYEYYISMEEHLEILNTLLETFSKLFTVVYFKFHPVEMENNKNLQRKVIEKYKNIEIIESSVAIEEIIDNYKPKYVGSFFSVALLNLYEYGIIPLYCYHYFSILMKNIVFQDADRVLMSIGYKFPLTLNKIKEINLDLNKNSTKTNLIDILRRDKDE